MKDKSNIASATEIADAIRRFAAERHEPVNLSELIRDYMNDGIARTDEEFLRKGFVGYRNKVRGDESTEILKVKSFTGKELNIRATVMELNRIIAAGEAAEKMLADIQSKCKHHVFYDSPGHPYDSRACRICNSGMGLL